MSTIIKILRSSGTTAPNALAQGELALTFGAGTQGNNGDRLFIGTGTETNGVAANIDVIGGKYFTNLTDHVHGTLTASSAIIVDSNKAIDELFIGNSASTGGTIKFNEGTNNGSNFVALKAPNDVTTSHTITLPAAAGTNGQFLRVDGEGVLSFADVSANLTFVDDSSTVITVPTSQSVRISGGTGLTSTASGSTITLDIDNTVATLTGTQTLTNKTLTTPIISSISNTGTLTLPTSTDTLVGRATTDTLTNKTLTTPIISSISNSGTLTLPTSTDTLVGRATTDTLTNKTIDGASNTISNIGNTSLTNSSITLADDTSSTTTISLGETLKISGDTGITATISGDTVNIDLDDTAVTPGTYGSSTAIPVIAIDQQGRITSASTQNISTTLTISDDSSSTVDITLGSDTLKIAGGTGITSSISGDTITLDIDSTVVTESSTDTLTNKSISLNTNTITGTLAEFNTAVSDADFASLAGSETLTNKTISGSSNTISNIGNSSLTNSAITISDDTSSTTTISLGETLKISGGTGITSSISGDTITLDIDSTVVTESSTDTLTNKSISLSTNTITGTLAEFNTAVSDADFASIAGTETLSNKTLTAPKIVDDGFIADANGNELILFNTIGSAVNQLEISNSATGNGVTIASSGSDSNINIVLDPKGTGTVDVNSSRITSLSDPSGDQDAATKAYVDSVANGLDVKKSVRVATTAALATVTYNNNAGTLTASANGALVIDGVTVSVADRVLIKNQASAVQNGIYVVTTTGSAGAAFVLTRGPDADTAAELTGGAFFFVEEGTDNADNGYVTTFNGTPTLGTTDINFVQFSGAGQISAGNALTKTGNTLDVAVDNTTIEVSSDALRVKASGIAANELATDAVTTVKIQDSAVTNAKLANSVIYFTDESSTQGSVSLGGNIEFLAGEGIDTTVVGNTVRISGELATSSNAGVAFFPTANFLVTTGSVSITKVDGGTF